MATLVASSSSSQGNPLVFSSSDTSNLFFGTSGVDYLSYTGKGKLTILDVSNGDVINLDAFASTGFTAKVLGNTVSLLNAKGTEIGKLGGLVSGESIKVQFNDGNFMTVVNDGSSRIYSAGSATQLSSTAAKLGGTTDLNTVKLTEADITTTISGSTVTVTIAANGQTFNTATVDFSLFGGSSSVSASASGSNYVATYAYTSLPVITGGVNGTAINLVNIPTNTTGIDFSDSVSVTVTKGTGTYADSVTIDNIAPVLNEALITTSAPTAGVSGTITVSIPNQDQLSNLISGVTVDFSEFGGPSEVEAILSGNTFVASATGTATAGESDQAIVTAVDIVGNVTTFIDAAPVA